MATSDHPHAEWQVATITGITIENSHAKTFHLTLPGKLPHLAGQHCDIRLSAPDGYQAARSYSIASAPESEDALEVTVAIIPGGEVSGYLGSTAKVGDQLEIKSPLGYYFVWTGKSATPVTLIAGGSGIVPLMSIIRHHQDICSSAPMRLLYSVRSKADLIYASELQSLSAIACNVEIIITLTDAWDESWVGHTGRFDRESLGKLCPLDQISDFYVCGPTPMVEAVASALTDIGHAPERIKTERFGPTGPAPTTKA